MNAVAVVEDLLVELEELRRAADRACRGTAGDDTIRELREVLNRGGKPPQPTLSIQEAPGEDGLPPGWKLKEVNRQRVTRGEALMAREVMAVFNEEARSRYHGAVFYRGIIGRLREHPDLTTADHASIIRYVLQNPWFKGNPTPNVIYGNEAVFERARNGRERWRELEGYGGERS